MLSLRIKGELLIVNNVHMALFSSFIGAGRIELQGIVNISSRVSVYSSNNDYSSGFTTNPTVSLEHANVMSASVIIQRYLIIRAGSIVLPGVTLYERAGVGALSLFKQGCEAFYMYLGTPAQRARKRSRQLLDLQKGLGTANA